MSKKKNHHSSKFLYHYTDIDALMSIIGRNTFWATNIKYLSDKRELIGGLDPLRQAFLSLIQSIEPNGLAIHLAKRLDESNMRHDSFNVLSFCTKRNYSYMWNHYAKNNGCCICFDKAKLLSAFNENKVMIPYKGKEIEYPLKPVNESFFKCRYIPKNKLSYEAKLYLDNQNIKYSDGKKKPLDFRKPMVYVKTMDKAMMNDPVGAAKNDIGNAFIKVDDVYVNLIGFALCTKIARTLFNYEKEKEERLIFFPLPNQQKVRATNIKPFQKEYLEIQLNKQLFLSSIKDIRINPKANNKASLVTRVTTAIREIYKDTATRPLVIGGTPHAQRQNKKTICRSFYKKRFKKLCKKTGWQSSMCYRGE